MQINLLLSEGKTDQKSPTATAQWEFHQSYGRRNSKPRSSICAFIEVSAVYRFCYKPNLTVLKSCMMMSRSSITNLCFDGDLQQIIFPHVSLSLLEDLHTHSTHYMQIILETRFQFPHCVMTNVLFPKVITIFKLIYLFWFKMEQKRWIWRYSLNVGFLSACFLSPFRGSCVTWLRRSLQSKTRSTPHNGKTIRCRPG